MLNFRIREAEASDINDLLFLIGEDEIGKKRESFDNLEQYERAFTEILDSPMMEFYVMVSNENEIVACCQCMFLPHLSRKGGKRVQIESVRVRSKLRGQGLGTQLMEFVKEQALLRGCRILQLTTDKRRSQALRFYESLGLEASHIGLKMTLAGEIE